MSETRELCFFNSSICVLCCSLQMQMLQLKQKSEKNLTSKLTSCICIKWYFLIHTSIIKDYKQIYHNTVNSHDIR
jgi:hypothetical protein